MEKNIEEKRLFIGAYFEKKIFEKALFDLKREFLNLCTGKWVELQNLHFTFNFLGNTNISLIPNILNALKEELKQYEASLIFEGLGVFPRAQQPRVLFVKIKDENELLKNIFNSIEQKLFSLKIQKEKYPFKSHITLCRLKSFKNPQFKEKVEKFNNFSFGELNNFSIHLIESQLSAKGPTYTIIK